MASRALLLLGPTGVGKSPLGEALEHEGWRGRRCHHFDFGAHLRAVSEGSLRPDALTDADVAVVKCALETGALLEDHEFPIAAAILGDFLVRRELGAGDLVVLNGLPRHVGQAEGVEEIVSIVSVIHLAAEPAVLCERIRLNAGGDRSGRSDDVEEAVLRRIERFRARTRPLLERYADRVLRVPIGLETGPEAVLAALAGV